MAGSRAGLVLLVTALLLARVERTATGGVNGGREEDMARVEAAIRDSFRAEAEGRLGDALAAVAGTRHPILQYREGKVLMQLERWGDAVERLVGASGSDPAQAGVLSTLAFALRQVGRETEACRALAAAARLDPLDMWVPPQRLALESPPHRPGRARPAGRSSVQSGRGGQARSGTEKGGHGEGGSGGGSVALVTASNSLYFGCVANFVGSAQVHAADVPVLLFDLGLNGMEREAANAWRGVEVVALPFAQLPPHVADIRNKAWKAFAIREALTRHEFIIFQDAGQEIRQPLSLALDLVSRDGYLFVIQTEKQLPNMVHPEMLTELGVSPRTVFGHDMCAAGILAVSNSSCAARSIVDDLITCSLNPRCIAPPGASVANHRFEQAALSVALARRNILCHNRWDLYAYLEEEQRESATPIDRANGFGRDAPVWISLRCRQPFRHRPVLAEAARVE